MCGMSKQGELSTQLLIDAGADIFAQDTYGYTPLHRMASNNLAIGAFLFLSDQLRFFCHGAVSFFWA